jgi:hypothetical protein
MSPVISFSLLLSAEGGIEHHHDDKSQNNPYGGLAVIAARKKSAKYPGRCSNLLTNMPCSPKQSGLYADKAFSVSGR